MRLLKLRNKYDTGFFYLNPLQIVYVRERYHEETGVAVGSTIDTIDKGSYSTMMPIDYVVSLWTWCTLPQALEPEDSP